MLRKSCVALAASSIMALVSVGSAQADGYEPGPLKVAVASPKIVDWTGVYVGVHGGYSWSETSGIHSQGDDLLLNQFDPSGWIYGGQIGYNFQKGKWVFGLEGDISGHEEEDDFAVDGPSNSSDFAFFKIDYLASIRGRLGIAHDQWLFFGTAGIGFAEYEFTLTNRGGGTPLGTGSLSFDEQGLVAGGGIEWSTRSGHVTIRGEYLHYDVGERVALTNPPIPAAGQGQVPDFLKVDDIDVVRAAVNFKFGHRKKAPPLK